MNKLKYPLPYYIRKALGLLPWEEFEKKIRKGNKDRLFDDYSKYGYYHSEYLSRGVGKTTRMLVQAVYFSQNREVYIRGYSEEYTRELVNKAKEMCIQLGVCPNNIKRLPKDTRGMRRDIWSFVDHHYPFSLSLNRKPSKDYF